MTFVVFESPRLKKVEPFKNVEPFKKVEPLDTMKVGSLDTMKGRGEDSRHTEVCLKMVVVAIPLILLSWLRVGSERGADLSACSQ